MRKNHFPTDNILHSLLAAREERAWLQKFMLCALGERGEERCVVQISLNVPGWPKLIEGGEKALSAGAESFLAAMETLPALSALISNNAGEALIYSFIGDGPKFAEIVKKNFGDRAAH